MNIQTTKTRTLPKGMQATLMACMAFFTLTEPAAAAGFSDFLNNILDEFLAVRRPLALIGLLMIGAAFTFNFVDLRKAGWTCVGIIIFFSAAEILDLIVA